MTMYAEYTVSMYQPKSASNDIVRPDCDYTGTSVRILQVVLPVVWAGRRIVSYMLLQYIVPYWY
jgi:hypothetical protein